MVTLWLCTVCLFVWCVVCVCGGGGTAALRVLAAAQLLLAMTALLTVASTADGVGPSVIKAPKDNIDVCAGSLCLVTCDE